MRHIVLLTTAIAWLAPAATADGPARVDESARLPLMEVILYTSGVGYFQRDGQVDADAQVELRFKTEDINDLL
jgi:hypothetical protein